MGITTPLGADKLLLTGFSGTESLSSLFGFRADCIAENETDVAFDKLLGQAVSVWINMAGGAKRHFNGICNRIAQGATDRQFTAYHLEIVPKVWVLGKKVQSRIFQHLNVTDILKKVLTGIDVDYQTQGTFEKRDYCVQYRESDLHFAQRLMEEEGIYYYFKHTAGGHKMVLSNVPAGHAEVEHAPTIKFENIGGGNRAEERITHWVKRQEMRSGKVTLWDHCFELPHKHLEADKTVSDSVPVGLATFKTKVGGNDQLEIYDFPGAYAQRFDGINKGGGDQAADLQKIFTDNKRTVEIRLQEETAQGILLEGASNCRQLSAGHKFTLQTVDADTLAKRQKADGAYVLTSVSHSATNNSYRSGDSSEMQYSNAFACIPGAVPYRPAQSAVKPTVHGTQTAVVVGPAGQEIFTDKYSRIKVQFHWDREGRNDSDSSCWVRVGTPWAGKNWGMIHIPRIGQEVVVDFLEGDPDQPIVVGSVYNADMMPPYTLPDNKTQSGIKSRSSLKGTTNDFNELRFEDKKDAEHTYFHTQKDAFRVVEHNDDEKVGFGVKEGIKTHTDGSQLVQIFNNQTERIGFEKCTDGNQTVTVWNNQDLTVGVGKTKAKVGDQIVGIWNNQKITVGEGKGQNADGSQTESIWKNQVLTVGASASDGSQTVSIYKDRTVTIKTGNDTLTIEKGNQTETLNKGNRSITLDKGNDSLTVTTGNITTKASAGKIEIEAATSIELKCGGSSIKLEPAAITIKSTNIKIDGSGPVDVQSAAILTLKGSLVKIN